MVINYVAERGGEHIRVLRSGTSCIFFRLIMVERQATCSTLKSYHVSVKTNERYKIINKNNNLKKKEAEAAAEILGYYFMRSALVSPHEGEGHAQKST